MRIKSLYSNKYIAVDSTTNTIIKQTSTLDYFSLWKFERTSSGNLMLVCKALSTTTVLALPSNVDNNGTNLTTVTYTSNTVYNDEWQIFEDVKFQDIALDIDDTVSVEIQSYGLTGDVNITDYSYTITSGSEYILERNSSGRITGLKSGAATVRATHKELAIYYTFEVKVNKNAIIIVPGIMGSQIFASETFDLPSENPFDAPTTFYQGERLWAPTVSDFLLIDDKIRALALNSNGVQIYGTATHTPIINQYNLDEVQYGATDMYRELYYTLYESFYDIGYDIVLYEYDWRKDPYDTALELFEFISEYGYGNIVFVSHSMGGLVSSYYLSLGVEQRNSVDKHISIGTPYLWSVEIPYMYTTGYCLGSNIENWVVSEPIQKIIFNLPSIYALLPFEQNWLDYMSYRSDPETMTACYTFSSTMSTLRTYMPNWNYDIEERVLLNRERLFLDNGMHITTLVDSYYIVGTGEDTTYYTSGLLDNLITPTQFNGFTLTKNRLGDGTVTEYSATIGNTAPSEKVYYKSSSSTKTGDHVGMVTGSISDSDQLDLSTLHFITILIDESINNYTAEQLSSLYSISQ